MQLLDVAWMSAATGAGTSSAVRIAVDLVSASVQEEVWLSPAFASATDSSTCTATTPIEPTSAVR